MLLDDRSKRLNVNWTADAFLVASPDGVMTKTIVPIASFSWGYNTDKDKKVTFIGPKNTRVSDWSKFSKMLNKLYPSWKTQK